MMVSTQNSQPTHTEDETDLLLSSLKAKGCKTPLKQGLHITPADQGSGRTDISTHHDQIFAE
jgi:hypothetical protein